MADGQELLGGHLQGCRLVGKSEQESQLAEQTTGNDDGNTEVQPASQWQSQTDLLVITIHQQTSHILFML